MFDEDPIEAYDEEERRRWADAMEDARNLRVELERYRLKWTTEVPTEPGWYWARLKDSRKPFCAEVWRDAAGLWCYVDDGAPVPLDVVREWAGPIPEPEDKG